MRNLVLKENSFQLVQNQMINNFKIIYGHNGLDILYTTESNG